MAPISRPSLLICISYVVAVLAHASVDEQSYKVFATTSLHPDAVCSVSKVIPVSSRRATVALNHRHGPCSPVPSSGEKPTLADLLSRDESRANYLRRQFSGSSRAGALHQADLVVPTTLGSFAGTLEYVITVGIGSPAVTQTLIIDTGSDISWVRCRSSAGSTLFDPTQSTTYTAFSCSAPACLELGEAGDGFSKSTSECQYVVHYGDRSSTVGTYGADTLALAGSDSEAVIADFRFGCSHEEEGFHDQTDGLMGLGGDAQSLVSQTAATYGNAFSYCLPPTPIFSGFLTLGAPSNTSAFATTPMIRSEKEPTFYAVLLQAIIVAGKELSVTPSVFSGGSLVDSGTVVTRLPPTAYAALSAAFRANMSQYPLAEAKSLMDTCFDFSGRAYVMIPSVALVFDGGAVVYLDANGIMLENCLAFAATDEDGSTGIIGNVQQRTFEVMYHVGENLIGFRPNAC
ncbi:hypothetical protein ACQ4PT_006020 [Festuca glaucescens]